MRRIVSVLMIVCLFMLSLAGCTGSTTTPTGATGATTTKANATTVATTTANLKVNPKGVFPIVPANLPPVALSIVVVAEKPFEADNYAIKALETKGNIKLNITTIPTAEAATKLNLMLAGGDYPDIFQSGRNAGDPITFTTARLEQYGVTDKIVVPLDGYIAQYGVEINKLLALRPAYKLKVSGSDGKIYGFPNAWECYHCTAYPKAWINVEWLKAKGLTMPQTTDDLEKVLVAFKADANKNGKADEIGITGYVGPMGQLEYWILNSFLPVSASYNLPSNPNFVYAKKDNSLVFSATQTEYADGLKYMKKLYSQGLIDPAAFTQNGDQFRILVRQTEPVVGIFVAPHIAAGIDITKREQSVRYEVLPPVAGPTGARYQGFIDYIDITGHSGMVITKKCQNPEVAFRYGDMSYEDELGMKKQSGLQGVGWDYATPGTKSIGGNVAKFWWTTQVPDDKRTAWNLSMFPYGPVNRTADLWDACMPVPTDIYDAKALEPRLSAATDLVKQYFYPGYVPTSLYMGKDSETFLDIQTNIVNSVMTNTARFITGSRDIDKEWATYVQEIQKLGLDTYMKLLQTKYTEYLAISKK